MIAYGLAVEHTLEDLTIWDGERGQVYFYQSELPYGVDQASFGDKYVVFENINGMSQRISIEYRQHIPSRHSKKKIDARIQTRL